MQRAVQEVKSIDSVGFWLGVPKSKQDEIRSQLSSVPQQSKVYMYINYFIEHDPVASWRVTLPCLFSMYHAWWVSQVCTCIPIHCPPLCIYMYTYATWFANVQCMYMHVHLSLSCADPTLTINNLRLVTASVVNWYEIWD